MKLKGLTQNYLAVEELEADDTTPGGIVLPGTVEQSVRRGVVVAAGPGRYEYGVFVETVAKEGDQILFGKFAGDNSITVDGKTLLIFRDSEIFGFFDDE